MKSFSILLSNREIYLSSQSNPAVDNEVMPRSPWLHDQDQRRTQWRHKNMAQLPLGRMKCNPLISPQSLAQEVCPTEPHKSQAVTVLQQLADLKASTACVLSEGFSALRTTAAVTAPTIKRSMIELILAGQTRGAWSREQTRHIRERQMRAILRLLWLRGWVNVFHCFNRRKYPFYSSAKSLSWMLSSTVASTECWKKN